MFYHDDNYDNYTTYPCPEQYPLEYYLFDIDKILCIE